MCGVWVELSVRALSGPAYAPAAFVSARRPDQPNNHHHQQRSLSQLERPVPITCALLGINIVGYYLPEIFLPFGINLLEVGAVCLQPARIVKLMASPPAATYYGGRSSSLGWDEWLSSFLSFGNTPPGAGAVSASAAARWQEAASRVWLSAFVHGDDLHLYYNMVRVVVFGRGFSLYLGAVLHITPNV